MIKKLNLGCGADIKRENGIEWVNLDFRKLKDVDVVHNLNQKPYPFKDKEFDEIVANHIFEHLISGYELTPVMEELYRILKKGGILKIRSPYYKSESAFSSPDHRNRITEKFFDWYTMKKSQSYMFDIIKIELVNKGGIRRFIPFKKLLNIFLWNIYDEIYFELKKID